MKITVKKGDLLPVLAKVQRLAGRKTNLAITTNLLMKTTDSGTSICVTDLETGFEGLYPAAVESEGTIAINARKFYEIVRDFPSDDIGLNEVENHWIEIGNEHVEYHIVGMNPDDFPEIPKIEAVEFFDLAISAAPDHLMSRFNKGIVLLYDMRDRSGAIEAWEDLASVAPFFTTPTGELITDLITELKSQ